MEALSTTITSPVRPEPADPVERLVDDLPHRLFLVQAGDDDGDLGRCGGHLVRRTTVACAPAGTFAEWG